MSYVLTLRCLDDANDADDIHLRPAGHSRWVVLWDLPWDSPC